MAAPRMDHLHFANQRQPSASVSQKCFGGHRRVDAGPRRRPIELPPRTVPSVRHVPDVRRNIGTSTARRRGRQQTAPARIFRTNAYVRDVTTAPAESRSRRCQGLHIATFLPYGFYPRSDWLPPGSVASTGFGLPPCREDECIDC